MFKLLQIIGVILASGMFAAMDDWGDGDIMIISRQGVGRTFQACFKGKEVVVEGASESGSSSNLYDEASEQVLAGYSFLPGIEESEMQDPSLYKSGVRQFICEKQPFSSKNLQKCLEGIEQALQNDQAVSVIRPVFWRNLTADVAKERFYSQGKQWQWSVVEKDEMTLAIFCGASLQIIFRGESDVLEGVLRDRDKTVLDKKPSLLDLKQAPPCPVSLQGLRISDCGDIPETPEDFFNPEKCRPFILNCGIQYFPGDGSQRGLLFHGDTLYIRKSTAYDWKKDCEPVEAVTDVLRMIFLQGYCLKHESCAEKNLQVLARPSVREVACECKPFLSPEAEWLLRNLGEYEKNARYKPTKNAWGGLSYQELASVFSTPRTPVWSLLGKEGLQAMMQQKYAYPRIVVFLDGERVALCGTLDQESPGFEDRATLFSLVCEESLQTRAQETR